MTKRVNAAAEAPAGYDGRSQLVGPMLNACPEFAMLVPQTVVQVGGLLVGLSVTSRPTLIRG